MENQPRCLKIQVLHQWNEIRRLRARKHPEWLLFLMLSFSHSPTLHMYSIAQGISLSVLNLQCCLPGIRQLCILLTASAVGQKSAQSWKSSQHDQPWLYASRVQRQINAHRLSVCLCNHKSKVHKLNSLRFLFLRCGCFNMHAGLGVPEGCNSFKSLYIESHQCRRIKLGWQRTVTIVSCLLYFSSVDYHQHCMDGQTTFEAYPETITVNSLMLSGKPKLILGCKLQQEMLNKKKLGCLHSVSRADYSGELLNQTSHKTIPAQLQYPKWI